MDKPDDATTLALDAFLAHTAGCPQCQQEPHAWTIALNRYVKLCEVGAKLALAVFADEVTE